MERMPWPCSSSDHAQYKTNDSCPFNLLCYLYPSKHFSVSYVSTSSPALETPCIGDVVLRRRAGRTFTRNWEDKLIIKVACSANREVASSCTTRNLSRSWTKEKYDNLFSAGVTWNFIYGAYSCGYHLI